MKRIFSFVLAVCLLLSLPAFAGAATDAFYATLGDYILYYDRVLEDELWAYKYAEKFNSDRTYDNLNIARVAVQSAMREISSMEAPVYAIGDTETIDMMMSGLEADALMYTLDEIGILREEKVIRLQAVFETLINDVYYQPMLDNLMEKIALYRQDIRLDAISTVHFMNYLLVQAGDKEKAEAFWESVRGQTKVVSEYMDEYLTDAMTIAEAEDLLLDEAAACGDELQKLIGFGDVYILLMEEAVQTGDTSLFIEGRTEIKGEYEVFPEAWWMAPEMGEYLFIFSQPGTDNLYVHSMGNEIERAPDRIKMTFTGVSGTDAVDYIKLLLNAGFSAAYELVKEEDGEKLYIQADKGASTLTVIWSEKETIVYLMPPAAMMMPLLYYGS